MPSVRKLVYTCALLAASLFWSGGCKSTALHSQLVSYGTDTVDPADFPKFFAQIRFNIGDQHGVGTALWVKPDTLITAAHVVDGLTSFMIGSKGDSGFVLEATVDTTIDRVAMHPDYVTGQAMRTVDGVGNDLAVITLKVPSPTRNSSNLARFAQQGAAINDTVTVAGFVGYSLIDIDAMSLKMGTATVASFAKVAHGITLSNCSAAALCRVADGASGQAMPTKGDSGGALLNAQGEVLGTVEAGTDMLNNLPIVAQYVNIHDPMPGNWLSQKLGSDTFIPGGYKAGWFQDTPLKAPALTQDVDAVSVDSSVDSPDARPNGSDAQSAGGTPGGDATDDNQEKAKGR